MHVKLNKDTCNRLFFGVVPNVRVFIEVGNLKNVRPTTKLAFESGLVGLRNYYFGTVDQLRCQIVYKWSLHFRPPNFINTNVSWSCFSRVGKRKAWLLAAACRPWYCCTEVSPKVLLIGYAPAAACQLTSGYLWSWAFEIRQPNHRT